MRVYLVFLMLSFGASCAVHGATQGTLFLSGGGTQEPRVIEKFVSLAGGSDAGIVVIPTASTIVRRADYEQIIRRVFMERGKATNLTILHTSEKAVANSADFVEPLLEARAVWIWGGQARRFMNVYSGTLLQKTLRDLHEKGTLIGGTSSGALVLNDLVVRPGDVETSEIRRENNIDGMGLLKGVLLDVHAIARNRLVPMQKALPDYPGRTVISIDENTAIILEDGVFEVFGRSYVVVYDVPGRSEPFLFLSHGDRFSLRHNMMTADDCSLWSAGCIELE